MNVVLFTAENDSCDLAATRERLKYERQNLPIRKARKRLLRHLSQLRNGTAILIGETGSGKTTQIPQVL
jgi:ATP-dependent RNA helicase DHX33